jgi:hypothetical protein
MILYKTEFYSLSLDKTVPCLVWTGKIKMDSDVFRESQIRLLELYQTIKKKYPKLEVLVDARVVGNVSTDDTTWLVEEILPPIFEAGLRKDAFIVPETALEKLIVRNFISKSGGVIEMKAFASVKAAKDWLKQE